MNAIMDKSKYEEAISELWTTSGIQQKSQECCCENACTHVKMQQNHMALEPINVFGMIIWLYAYCSRF